MFFVFAGKTLRFTDSLHLMPLKFPVQEIYDLDQQFRNARCELMWNTPQMFCAATHSII